MNKDLIEVPAPLLSPNEPEARVTKILVAVGDKIDIGDTLCVLETSKATFDIEAEHAGYVHGIRVATGEMITAGAPILDIGAAAPQLSRAAASAPPAGSSPSALPAGMRVTQKAAALARELGIDVGQLPADVLVTEAVVRAQAESLRAPKRAVALEKVQPSFDAGAILVYGAGGHSKTIIDVVRRSAHFRLHGIVADPLPRVSDVMGVPVLGDSGILDKIVASGVRLIVNAVGSIGHPSLRVDIFARLAKRGFGFPTIVHPLAVIEPSVRIAAAVQVFGSAFLGSDSSIGFGAIINTGVIVSHDCIVEDYAHLTPGVVLAGSVRVGTGALVGMGVTTQIGVTIGEWARIGNGARIYEDVPPHTIVPAGESWPRKAS